MTVEEAEAALKELRERHAKAQSTADQLWAQSIQARMDLEHAQALTVSCPHCHVSAGFACSPAERLRTAVRLGSEVEVKLLLLPRGAHYARFYRAAHGKDIEG